MQVSTFLFNNTVPCLTTGHVRMFFLVSDLNTSCFLGSGGLYRDSHHLLIKVFLLCFALTSSLPKPNPLLQDSACTSCGTWEVGSSPAAALLGWRVPREAQRLVPRKYHCLSPGSSWQAQFCTPPFPFSSLSVAEGRETHIFFPHPASPPSPPPCTLLAPGSCEAIPDEMALSLALTTRGKAAPCMPCQDADEGKEPSPHME